MSALAERLVQQFVGVVEDRHARDLVGVQSQPSDNGHVDPILFYTVNID